MSLIKVDPASIQQFVGKVNDNVEQIQHALNGLVSEVSGVHYYGPNSVNFKQTATEMSSTYANQVQQLLTEAGAAINTSTNNIAVALGSSVPQVNVSPMTVKPADITNTNDVVDVDTSALNALTGPVTARTNNVAEALKSITGALESTIWQGAAKDAAVQAVGDAMNGATRASEDACNSINDYINKQVESVIAADK